MDVSQDLFNLLTTHAALLALKMIFMSYWTVTKRSEKQAFSTEEDAKRFGKPINGKPPPVKVDQDVERIRRAHRNDIENILIFLILSAFYIHTGPSYAVAAWHFRAFTIGRFVYSAGYLLKILVPRNIGYHAGFIATISISLQILWKFGIKFL